MIDAFHLPGLTGEPDGWEILETGAGEPPLRVPRLSGADIAAVAHRLRGAREEHLAPRRTADIIEAIDTVVARLGDPDGRYRPLAERLLPLLTGYAPAMISLGLDRMLEDWRAPALHDLVRSEFEDPGVLDEFRPRRRAHGTTALTRACGPVLSFQIFAGNVPGVAVTSLIRALLVKAAAVGKTARGEPLLPALFAHAATEAAPWLAECLAVTYWPGGSESLERSALEAADLVIAYGGEAMLGSLRRRLPPLKRVVVHGPGLSLGLVGRSALDDASSAARTAADVARAVAIFDQQGCVSPHLVYAESGGAVAPPDFAGMIAAALRSVQTDLPRGRISPAEAAAIRSARAEAEFRATRSPGLRVHASSGTEFTVVYDPDPEFAMSCLNRFLWVKPLDDIAAAAAHVAPFAGRLQTVGAAGLGDRSLELAPRLARLGVSRIAPFDAMPWPQPSWHHDGAEPLRELVRWIDLDEETARADPGRS